MTRMHTMLFIRFFDAYLVIFTPIRLTRSFVIRFESLIPFLFIFFCVIEQYALKLSNATYVAHLFNIGDINHTYSVTLLVEIKKTGLITAFD